MMFSAFQTFGKLGAIGKAIAAAWSPLSLWPDGIASPGMWISPRTLDSQWQDYTGTTPVATPGTVADSANPVGLAYDLRAGTPVLGPEINNNPGGPFVTTTGYEVVGNASISVVSGALRLVSGDTPAYQTGFRFNVSVVAGKYYKVTSPGSGSSWRCMVLSPDLSIFGSPQSFIFRADGATSIYVYSEHSTAGFITDFDNISVREVPGNHMLESTSAARPLMSAYDGQTLGPGNTYDATGYPIFQKYDGVDDGMATAAFAAGTLINGMDCLIAVRRDSAASCVAGLYNGVADATKFFGMAESASGSGCVGSGAGTPTVWVDNTQLTGGTAVTRGTLHTALTGGDWHILEFRNLDLSTWTAAGFGLYTSYVFPGLRGDIMLYPSTDSTTDKDAARQWLADYYGVTLP